MTRTYKNEKDVKKHVNEILNKHKWFWWNTIQGMYSTAGVSDKLAYRTGILIAIETKFGTNKPTKMQAAFLESIRAEDGFAFVVNDKNIEWFDGFLAAFDRAAEAASKGISPTEDDGAYMINAIRELSFSYDTENS